MPGDHIVDKNWGLLPEIQGWREWFAWRPVLACGRIRWLSWIQCRYLWHDDMWEYVAGRSHDYPDSYLAEPTHFYTHRCRHCSARFTI